MVFKLVRTDLIDTHKIELPIGEHLFGRGKFLDCEDKRISRKHGQLKVTEDTVVLKALHQNPCFYSKSGSEDVVILKLDNVTKLSHGDRFGLLPTSYWYEVLYTTLPANNNQPQCIQNNVTNTLQATQPMDTETERDIPHEADIIANNTIINGRSESPTYSQNETHSFGNESELLGVNFDEPVEENVKAESPSLIPPDNIEAPPPIPESSPTQPLPAAVNEPPLNPNTTISPTKRVNAEELDTVDLKKIKTEPQDGDGSASNAGLDAAGPSNPTAQQVKAEPPSPVKPPNPQQPRAGPSRERCFYGARCYRKNPQHKADFSHPSDADWGSGDLGQCPHGASCVKNDPRHWQTHLHPPGTQQPSNRYQPGKNHRQQRQPKRKKSRKSDSSDSSEVSPVSQDLPKKRVRKTVKRAVFSGSESENEYDMEDPFLTDGSDDWQPSGDDVKDTQDSLQDSVDF